MSLWKLGKYVSTAINYIAKGSSVIGMVFLLGMIAIVVADVFMRFCFRSPILGTVEIVEFMMLSLSFLIIALCVLDETHIRMDILFSRFPDKTKKILEIVHYILCLCLFIPMTIRFFPEAVEKFHTAEKTFVVSILHYPFYFIVLFGCCIVSLALLNNLVKTILEVNQSGNKS